MAANQSAATSIRPAAAPAPALFPSVAETASDGPSTIRQPAPPVARAPALRAETHAENARFANAILGTGNHDDAARSALTALAGSGEAGAESMRDLLRQLHERDPEAAESFASSVQRLARETSGGVEDPEFAPEPSLGAWLKREIGHILFPRQVASDSEKLWQELAWDVVPFLGNLRSASQAAGDIKEVKAAFQRGDYWSTAGHSLMTAVDLVGAFPGAGNLIAPAKPLIRNAVRATPGAKRVHASWALARAKRQFKAPLSASVEELYGDVWKSLPKSQQRRLTAIQSHITGYAGEDYLDELLPNAGFKRQGDGLVSWTNAQGKPKIRRYDAETAEQFRTIFFDLFAIPDLRHNSRVLYEAKTAGGELSKQQKVADAAISQTEAIHYLRLRLDEVPFEFLAAQTKRLLEGGAAKGKARFTDEEIGELIDSMRRARRPDGMPLTTFDWLGVVSRISAEAARDDGD